jgi:hypothetical protein
MQDSRSDATILSGLAGGARGAEVMTLRVTQCGPPDVVSTSRNDIDCWQSWELSRAHPGSYTDRLAWTRPALASGVPVGGTSPGRGAVLDQETPWDSTVGRSLIHRGRESGVVVLARCNPARGTNYLNFTIDAQRRPARLDLYPWLTTQFDRRGSPATPASHRAGGLLRTQLVVTLPKCLWCLAPGCRVVVAARLRGGSAGVHANARGGS